MTSLMKSHYWFRQPIIWANVDQDLCHDMAFLGHSKLTTSQTWILLGIGLLKPFHPFCYFCIINNNPNNDSLVYDLIIFVKNLAKLQWHCQILTPLTQSGIQKCRKTFGAYHCCMTYFQTQIFHNRLINLQKWINIILVNSTPSQQPATH